MECQQQNFLMKFWSNFFRIFFEMSTTIYFYRGCDFCGVWVSVLVSLWGHYMGSYFDTVNSLNDGNMK